jgi:hypothetical protein
MVDMSKCADCGEKFSNDTCRLSRMAQGEIGRLPSEKSNEQNIGANPCQRTSSTRSGC